MKTKFNVIFFEHQVIYIWSMFDLLQWLRVDQTSHAESQWQDLELFQIPVKESENG